MKETMSDISIILPVHELTENTKELFSNAIKSVEQQKVMPEELVIVTPKGSETAKYLKSYDYGKIKTIVSIVENEGETDFASQVNLGVSKAKYNWVSFLELDDEYANIWFKNVVEYREAHKNVDIFMPIVVDVDSNGSFAGFTNEAVWATGFSDELGVLDLNALLMYQNFNIDGIVMRKSTKRINSASVQPRKNPATAPMIVPTAVAINPIMNITKIDRCAPRITNAK